MYADVVVLTYQPAEIATYTYEVPREFENKIKVGQVVCVPFGKRNPFGIVLFIVDRPSTIVEKIKPITFIVLSEPIILTYQIDLLKWMASYYHAPMVNCLEAMLPKAMLNAKRLKANAIAGSSSIRRSALGVQQTIVLVPSINRIAETLAMYPQAKNYVIYHNELKLSEKFATWMKIKNGAVDFIFGSRSAIFIPAPNLKKIIIYDEHENAYKSERSPYFDTLTIAEKINELTGADIEIFDHSPRITTYFVHKKMIATKGGPKVKIISMISEKAAGNRSPIAYLLASYIKIGYSRGKKILLFLNKKTESGHIYCRICKYSEFLQKQPEVCPNCQSSDILFYSLNINSLARLVKQIVPQAQINLIAEGTKQSNYPAIDIATAAVFYKLIPQRYDLVAHIAVDSTLNIADFTSSEKTYQVICDLKKITKGLLVLQSYNPDDPSIQAASKGDYRGFFERQIAERKSLLYPPFSLLVKLTIKGKDDQKLEQKAQKVASDLKLAANQRPEIRDPLRLSEASQRPVTILGPYKPIFIKKVSEYNIILKIPIDDYGLQVRQQASLAIEPILKNAPSDWQIIVEPSSIN